MTFPSVGTVASGRRLPGILLLSSAAIIGILSACSDPGVKRVEIRFALSGRSDSQHGAPGIAVRDLRFYVHRIELLDQQGIAHPLALSAAPSWQSDRIALVDLVGSTPDDRNDVVRGTIAGAAVPTFSGIRFTVGVPFELNHANPLTAPQPLDRGEMFWAWQTGYKFMRVDLADAGGEWSFHLGSTGCSSAAAVRPPAAPCAQPHLLRVQFDGFDPLRQSVVVQLDELAKSMLAANRAICTGNYAHEPGCADIFRKTGLDLDAGSCPGEVCREQRLFGVE